MYNIGDFEHKMLIASPEIGSTVFQNSIVYVYSDTIGGSLGIITNFAVDRKQATVWSDEIEWSWPEKIYYGGPVNSHLGAILHSNDYANANTALLSDTLSYTNGQNIIKDLNRGTGPLLFSMVLGFCKWEPGQLNNEVLANKWRLIDYDEAYMFNTANKKAGWEFAIDREAEKIVNQLVKSVDTD